MWERLQPLVRVTVYQDPSRVPNGSWRHIIYIKTLRINLEGKVVPVHVMEAYVGMLVVFLFTPLDMNTATSFMPPAAWLPTETTHGTCEIHGSIDPSVSLKGLPCRESSSCSSAILFVLSPELSRLSLWYYYGGRTQKYFKAKVQLGDGQLQPTWRPHNSSRARLRVALCIHIFKSGWGWVMN